MYKKIIFSFVIAFSVTVLSLRNIEAQDDGTCENSPKVRDQIESIVQKLDKMHAGLQSQCFDVDEKGRIKVEYFREEYQSLYVEFLSVGTELSHLFSSLQNEIDITGNHNLMYDVASFLSVIREFDRHALHAMWACNESFLLQLLAEKKNFLDGETLSDGSRSGIYALRHAERATIDAERVGQPNYYYQDGYYLSVSGSRCSVSGFRVQDTLQALEETRQQMSSTSDSQQDLEEGEDIKEQIDEERKDDGLMTSEKANTELRKAQRFENDRIRRLDIDIDNESAVLVGPLPNYQDIQDNLEDAGHVNIGQEDLNQADSVARNIRMLELDMEQANRRAHFIYNQIGVPIDNIGESLVQGSDLIIKDHLCPLTKEAADNLVLFCRNVVVNNTTICDDFQNPNSSCE